MIDQLINCVIVSSEDVMLKRGFPLLVELHAQRLLLQLSISILIIHLLIITWKINGQSIRQHGRIHHHLLLLAQF